MAQKVLKMIKELKRKRIINKEDPRICDDCGQTFKHFESYRNHHKMKHRGKEPVQCSFCTYKTVYKTQLMGHERSHTGEKPEMCNWCGVRFSLKSILKNHERLHTGEKPFKCTLCDKAFAQRNSLDVHRKSNHPAS